jgi:hypothetical protein
MPMPLPLPRIVAICGAKRAGKDSIARVLQEEYGYEHLQISRRLKEACQVLFGFTADQLESDAKETADPRWGVSPRRVMQYLGTEVFQYGIHEPSGLPELNAHVTPREFWIKATLDFVDRNGTDRKYVITDLRFLHEERLLKERGAFIVKVVREANPCARTDMHVSEREYLAIKEHVLVINDGSLVDLRSKLMVPDFFRQGRV